MKRMQTSEKNDYFDFKDTCKLNRRIFLPQLEMVRLAWYLNVFSMSFLFAFFMVTNCTHKFCDYIWHKVLESYWYISFFFHKFDKIDDVRITAFPCHNENFRQQKVNPGTLFPPGFSPTQHYCDIHTLLASLKD